MFKLLAIAMHFSPYQQGMFDPNVARYMNNEYLNSVRPQNVVELPIKADDLRKAA